MIFIVELYSLFCFANEMYGAIVFSSKTQIVFNNHHYVKTSNVKIKEGFKTKFKEEKFIKKIFQSEFPHHHGLHQMSR